MFIFTQAVIAQNAPITTAGNVLVASPGPIVIPITVTDFTNIGSITLKLTYDPAVIQYTGSTANPGFSGMVINGSTPGVIIIGWVALASPHTLPDGSTLADLNFNYSSGSTTLTWDNSSSSGAECEYTDGSYAILNDDPTADYYKNGFITDHAAPITYAPTITDATPGPVDVPITVDYFTDIGAVALTLEYDPNILTFNGFTANGAFGGAMSVGATPSSFGKYKVVISWYSDNPTVPVSLVDGSTLVTLHFTYAAPIYVGNYSELTWLTDGTACEYGDPYWDPLYDLPYENFYIDGLVTGQLAPGTYLPVITNASPGPIVVPVTVVDFNNIGAIALTFNYDASVITYNGYTANAVFPGLQLGNQVNGTIGKITIGYYGNPVALPDLSSIVDIDFTYVSGTTELSWKTDGFSCEYGDHFANPLWDMPFEDYYFNGLVAGQVAPSIKADSVGASIGTQVSVPVRIWGFNNISSMSLTLDYDPGVLTYVDATPIAELAGDFSAGAVNAGRIQMGWFNSSLPYVPLNLTDETVIIYLNFNYHGGTSPLIWFNNGGFSEFTLGSGYEILYDLPTEDHYINGLVEPADYIWIGPTSTDWYTASNWSSNLVPNSLSQVFIPSSPTPNFCPVYVGDFTLGDQCNRIAFDDNSVMTVTGDMIIEPGHAFINAGDGLLKVGGDWLNSGVFELGIGEVEFMGAVDGYVPTGVLPAQDVKNYSPTTTPALMTPISGGLAGPTGDNAHIDVAIGFTLNYAGIDYTQA
ncbi:MAG: hypothetical protein DRQ43_03265, partial [Gammaproteobacteria bacterium]